MSIITELRHTDANAATVKVKGRVSYFLPFMSVNERNISETEPKIIAMSKPKKPPHLHHERNKKQRSNQTKQHSTKNRFKNPKRTQTLVPLLTDATDHFVILNFSE